MSKKTAPGMWAASYSSRASRPEPGRKVVASRMRRASAPSAPAIQSVETSDAMSEDARKGAAIDQQALAGDVAGLGRAEEGAGGAELGGQAEAPGGDGLFALGA